ncbi:acetyl-CoA synthetase-like protein [Wolfiporia cocos MD-104 SS10]|uniref:Acetyl-CoA synthetase-like protein n=1 Tax=Wolfiporia cocos (strain MD-104) TaxID=742152 RepID=A0A2H3JR60_WOLCO|nr:acetyl-CoA synthetase-like protein [Wolfiporia cocos MD-104 SS10]
MPQPARKLLPPYPRNQGLSSPTFRQPPLDGSLTLPELYEWYAEHSPDRSLFVYTDDDDKVHHITWKQAAGAVRTSARLIGERVGWTSGSRELPVVAVLATSDSIPYSAMTIGLMRAGYVAFLLSTRNSPAATAHLLSKVGVRHVFVGQEQSTLDLIKEALDLMKAHDPSAALPETSPMPVYEELYLPSELCPLSEDVPYEFKGSDAPALVLHSSGSTAFPKPILMTNYRLNEIIVTPCYGERDLADQVLSLHTTPMFHAMGVMISMWAVSAGLIFAVFAPRSPPPVATPDAVIHAAQATDCDIILSVPSTIEAWSRDPSYVKWLATRTGVSYGGGPLNKEVGDYLVSHGVSIFNLYGSTECAVLNVFLPAEVDKDWEYFQLAKNIDARLIPHGDNAYEFVVLMNELVTPSVLNTKIDGVDGYDTSDLLQPHPTKPGHYKILGRADDQIMHSTGEKTNPGPLETMMNQDPHVNASVMFGRGRFQAGILVDPKPEFRFDPSDEARLAEFRNKIWPTIERMNAYAPQHSRLFKEMIIVSKPSKPFTYTAKGTVRRGAVTSEYEDEVNQLYETVASSAQSSVPPPSGWDITSTTGYIRDIIHKALMRPVTDDDDLFQHGCDSLQATNIHNTVLHALRESSRTDTRKIVGNFVYDHPTISKLGAYVASLAAGQHTESSSAINVTERVAAMRAMVEKYTKDFPVRLSGDSTVSVASDGDVVLLTGSTGGLGCHLLAQLVSSPEIARIYALNRPSRGRLLSDRQRSALVERGLDAGLVDSEKVVLLEGELTKSSWGLPEDTYDEIHRSVTHIIHNAWRVDFVINLSSFEDSVHGLRKLIDFALTSPLKIAPRVAFTSSIGIYQNSPCDIVFSEAPVSPELPVGTGYAESKWVSEQILYDTAARTPLKALVIRVGQICGGLDGAWNAHEWFPTLVQSAPKLGCFPDDSKSVDWVPIEIAASAVIDFRKVSGIVHLVHPRPTAWHTLARAIADIFTVPLVPYEQWLAVLERAAAATDPSAAQDGKGNATLRALSLLDFFRGVGAKLETGRRAMGLPELEVTHAVQVSPTLADPALRRLCEEDVTRWIAYWERTTFGANSSPYDWQLDVTEALLLGLDTIVIAGTGAGKTMPFSMPFLLEENREKIIVIISPLDQLEEDQVSDMFLNVYFPPNHILFDSGKTVSAYGSNGNSCKLGDILPTAPPGELNQSSRPTYRQPPLDGSLTLPELYEWHAEHSPEHRLFIYADANGEVQHITWKQAAGAVRTSARLIRERVNWTPGSSESPVVAILASSDSIPYVAMTVGLMRAGYIAFLLSPRNSPAAIAHLLSKVCARHVLVGQERSMSDLIEKALDLMKANDRQVTLPGISPMPVYEELYIPSERCPTNEDVPYEFKGPDAPALILHSSGTTAFPKPIIKTNYRLNEVLICPCYGERDLADQVLSLHTTPMFHGMGVFVSMWAASSGLTLAVFAPRSPPPVASPETVIDAIRATDCAYILTIPSTLEAWSRNSDFVDLLTTRAGVLYGGGPLNKEVGDYLISQGVGIWNIYGFPTKLHVREHVVLARDAAEFGKDWEYFQIAGNMSTKLVQQYDNTYELVVLVRYYRILGRVDDQIMHSTGEKTNPGPLEAMMNQDTHVHTSVMFGRGRYQAGILVDPEVEYTFDASDEAKLSEFRNKIWPTIEKMNAFAPQHSRLFKEMIIVSKPLKPFTYTAKGTLRRGAVIDVYEDEINQLYETVEASSQSSIPPPSRWDIVSTTDYVRAVTRNVLVYPVKDDDDIFQHGCDSLQATNIRNTLLRALQESVQTDTRKLVSNFVYDYPTISKLGGYVAVLAAGQGTENSSAINVADRVAAMRVMVEKYTKDFPSRPSSNASTAVALDGDVVLLTGSTGGLGCHLLAQLAASSEIARIYALNRPSSGRLLSDRQRSVLVERGLDAGLVDSEKVVLLEGEPTKSNWGLPEDTYNEIHRSVTHVIHNAWRVDFAVNLPSFEDNVCSDSPCDTAFPEAPVDAELPVGTGYAESKWVSEQILYEAAARTTLKTLVIRVGQICSGLDGAWNAHEYFPTIVQSAPRLGCFPDDPKDVDWVPADISACAIADFRRASGTVHLVHPRPTAWHTLARVVADTFGVPLVPYAQWLAALERVAQDEGTKAAPRALSLLPFFRGAGAKVGTARRAMGFPELAVERAVRASPTLADPALRRVGEEDVRRWVKYWEKLRRPLVTQHTVISLRNMDISLHWNAVACRSARGTRQLCKSAATGEDSRKTRSCSRDPRSITCAWGGMRVPVSPTLAGVRCALGGRGGRAEEGSHKYQRVGLDERKCLPKCRHRGNANRSLSEELMSGVRGARVAVSARCGLAGGRRPQGEDVSDSDPSQSGALDGRMARCRAATDDHRGAYTQRCLRDLLPNPSPAARLPWLTRRLTKAFVASLTAITVVLLIVHTSHPTLMVGKDPEELSTPEPEQMPPLYERFYEYERRLPQHQVDPPDAKYFWIASHVRLSGWGNMMQELLLHAYLAHRIGRTFVWDEYTWNEDGSKYSLYNGKPIPSRIPLTAVIAGPTVGAPFHTDPSFARPASVSKEYFDRVCPENERRKLMNQDVDASLGHTSTAGTLIERWVEVMRDVDDRCVELPRDSSVMFDIWIMGDKNRLLDVWPGFSQSPVVREFAWSPLVELAFDMNRELLSPSSVFSPYLSSSAAFLLPAPPAAVPSPYSTPSAASTNAYVLPAERYAPLPGLLAMHVRRGDFVDHCVHLGRWSSSYVGFASIDALPDRLDVPQMDDESRIVAYRAHCFPSVAQIVARARAVRDAEAAAGRAPLRDVYVMTNGDAEWVKELKSALTRDGWANAASSRDLVVNPEQRYVKQAVDMLVGQRAQVFLGNGFSSLSGQIVMLRLASGIAPDQNRFFR